MSEMVERVAKALWRLDNPADEGFSEIAPNNWDAWPEHGRAASLAQVNHCKDDYRDQARAAIAAMREPTLPMITHSGQYDQYAGVIWRAMIAAALA